MEENLLYPHEIIQEQQEEVEVKESFGMWLQGIETSCPISFMEK